MSITNDVKLKAQAAIKPFLEGNYPENVKNPILLLNYLYQHGILPRPNYINNSRTQDSSRKVTCQIGDLEMTGSGNTTKIAKRNAAEKFLECLLKDEKCVNNGSTEILPYVNGDIQSENHYNMLFCSSENGHDTKPSLINQSNIDFENYFDPFFKSRPPTSDIMETENSNESDQSEPKVEEESINLESANVFAILQKKTQKHLKLVPRFLYDTCESGFCCRVHIGPYNASGEGRNKKKAKTNAVISLLNQMNDLA